MFCTIANFCLGLFFYFTIINVVVVVVVVYLFIYLFIFRVNEIATSKLARMVRSHKEINSVTVEELSLVLSNSHLPERALCQLLSSLTSLLRVWTVHKLNLSEFKIDPQLLGLLCHQGPLSIK